MARDSLAKTAAPLVVLAAVGLYGVQSKSGEEQQAAGPFEFGVYYRYCSDARAAGKAPLYRGQPGYAAHLDRDGDGIACEPYRGN
jgi:Excalibur calcium-binding domain